MFSVNDRYHQCLKTTVFPLLFSSLFLVVVFLSHFPSPFPAVLPPFSLCFPAPFSRIYPRCFPAVFPQFSRCFPPFFLPESVQSAVDTWFLSQQASSSLHLENGGRNLLKLQCTVQCQACCSLQLPSQLTLCPPPLPTPLYSNKARYDVEKGRPSSLGFSIGYAFLDIWL